MFLNSSCCFLLSIFSFLGGYFFTTLLWTTQAQDVSSQRILESLMMTGAQVNRNVHGFDSDSQERLVKKIPVYRVGHQGVNGHEAYDNGLMNVRSERMDEGKKPCKEDEPQENAAAQFGASSVNGNENFLHALNETELRNLLLKKYVAKYSHGVMGDSHAEQSPKKDQSLDDPMSLLVLHQQNAKDGYSHFSHLNGAVQDKSVPPVGSSLYNVKDRNTSVLSFLNPQTAAPHSPNSDDSVLLERLKSIRSRLNNFMRSVHPSSTPAPQQNKVQLVSDQDPMAMKGSLEQLQELVAEAKHVSNEFRVASLLLSKKLADSLLATNCTSSAHLKPCDWKEHFFHNLGSSSSPQHLDETSLRMLQKVAVEKSLSNPADARLFHIISHCLENSDTSLTLTMQLEELLQLLQLLHPQDDVNPLIMLTLNLDKVLKSLVEQGDEHRAISTLTDFHEFFSRLEYYWIMSEKDQLAIQQLDETVLDLLEALLEAIKKETFLPNLGHFKQRFINLRNSLAHLNVTLTPNLDTFPAGLVSENLRNHHTSLTLNPPVIKGEAQLQKPSQVPRVTSSQVDSSPPRSLQFIHRVYGHSNATQDFLQRFDEDVTSRLNRLFQNLHAQIIKLNTFVHQRHGPSRLFHHRPHLSPSRLQLFTSVSQAIQKHLDHLNTLRSHAQSHFDRRLDSVKSHNTETYHYPFFFLEFFGRKVPKRTERSLASRVLHPNLQGSYPKLLGCHNASCSDSVSTMVTRNTEALQGFSGDALAWKDKRFVRHFTHISQNVDNSLQHYAAFLMSLKRECIDDTTFQERLKDVSSFYSKLTTCENIQISFSKVTEAVEKLRDLLDLTSRLVEAEAPSTIYYLTDQVNKVTECSVPT